MPEDILSQVEVERGITQVLRRLVGLVDEVRTVGNAAATAEADYKHAYATARITERLAADKTTVSAVDDAATVATIDAYRAHLIAESNLRTVREALNTQRARLDGLRSLLVSVREATR